MGYKMGSQGVPISSVLSVLISGVIPRFSITNFGNSGDFGNLFSPHPAFFQFLLQIKEVLGINPWGDAWVALGWPLRGPWVAQG